MDADEAEPFRDVQAAVVPLRPDEFVGPPSYIMFSDTQGPKTAIRSDQPLVTRRNRQCFRADEIA